MQKKQLLPAFTKYAGIEVYYLCLITYNFTIKIYLIILLFSSSTKGKNNTSTPQTIWILEHLL